MSNPNFPQNLDIQPSTSSFTTGSNSSFQIYDYDSQKQAIEKYGIAGRVWEAAYILNVYLNPPQRLIFDPPFRKQGCSQGLRIIELGSGSGMIGINMSRSLNPERDLLILTDLPEVCPLLENNVDEALMCQSLRDSIKVRPLAWGNSKHAQDLLSIPGFQSITHILCSDLVYFPELLAPLLRTLIQLSSSQFAGPQLRVLISYKIRSLSKETPFWSAFGLWFEFEPVLSCEGTLDCSKTLWKRFGSALEGPMFIFVARRRPESLTWIVPSDDQALLAGFGAHGTMQAKADETFESLLFMSMVDDIEP
ncbi:hypothetical protein GYMLUDRAFT_176135 [Collybiopsis luxurians FD-317 M1]|uniref:Unplaced genomic scaffold GYMLUscaffold_61, whole genome shotgun sequence n=1 Tax=Collybiopsis luxurians FD-317 M1 TaxID=944289 RepID=A0A0D0BKB0_9AGAR|nr:hypothetical protein GYMLUDRAFT_176135 [Collybiopsis luxurians FD-317 M1]